MTKKKKLKSFYRIFYFRVVQVPKNLTKLHLINDGLTEEFYLLGKGDLKINHYFPLSML